MEEIQLKILKVLFYGQLLLEANDDLANTPFFKQRLKHTVNQASKEVERQIKIQLEKVYEQDNEFSNNMFEHIDLFVTKCSKMSVMDLPIVNKVLDEYLADPEHWKANIELEFKRING